MRTQILSHRQASRTLDRLAYQIIERNRGASNLELIGIRARGSALATALSDRVGKVAQRAFAHNRLDVEMYRDDRNLRTPGPDASQVNVDVNDRDVILVDDVLYTGRTARAAMDALVRYGRPSSIQLLVLIDRGHREYPIHADYAGLRLPTKADERVVVEVGDEIAVYLDDDF